MTSRVASGVRSVGVIPVPPLVSTVYAGGDRGAQRRGRTTTGSSTAHQLGQAGDQEQPARVPVHRRPHGSTPR
jgi:hypothetical protein